MSALEQAEKELARAQECLHSGDKDRALGISLVVSAYLIDVLKGVTSTQAAITHRNMIKDWRA